MGHYEEIKKMYNTIEKIVEQAAEGVNINYMIYELTKIYAVSKKSIQERVKQLQELKIVKVEGDIIKWNKKDSKNT